MKTSLFLVLFLSLTVGLKSQISYPTNREIYDFSVGDTFIYNYWHYSGCDLNAPNAYICSHDYYVVITSKSFSLDSNTVYYSYVNGGYNVHLPFSFPTSYSNLDSPVIITNVDTAYAGPYDTTYVDSSYYCLPRKVASVSNYPGTLSDFFDSVFESGLGLVGSYYHASQGSPEYQNYSLQLIYYHKDSIICGQYDARMLVNSISQSELNFNVRLFPNPANNLLEVEGLSKAEQYFIYDIGGAICQKGLCQKQINTEGLTDGIYFIAINVNGEFIYRKFIKH